MTPAHRYERAVEHAEPERAHGSAAFWLGSGPLTYIKEN